MENLNNLVKDLTAQEKQVWAEHRAENTKWEQENLKVELTTRQRYRNSLIDDIVKMSGRSRESLKGLNVQQLERIFDHC